MEMEERFKNALTTEEGKIELMVALADAVDNVMFNTEPGKNMVSADYHIIREQITYALEYIVSPRCL